MKATPTGSEEPVQARTVRAVSPDHIKGFDEAVEAEKKVGAVEGKIASLLAKAHRGGLNVRERVQRFDGALLQNDLVLMCEDTHNISSRFKEFDQKYEISEKMEHYDQRITRWEKQFNAQEKVENLSAATIDKLKQFGDKHPRLRDTTTRFVDKTNKALAKLEKSAGKFAKKIENSDVAQGVMKQVNKIRAKFATVTEEAGRQVDEQTYQDEN